MVSTVGLSAAPRRVAVYWHLENLVASQYNKLYGSGQWTRDKLNTARKVPDDLALALGRARIDAKALVTHARSIGDMVVNRVYADWSVGMYKEYRLGLSETRPVDFVQMYRGVPVRTDLQLPMDVMRDVDRHPHITDVVVCSGTVGFDAVAAHCAARGRRVHAVGLVTGHNAPWRAATQFTDYAEVASAPHVPPLPAATRRALMTPFRGNRDTTLGFKAFRAAAEGVEPKALGYPSLWGLLRTAALEGFVEVEGTTPDKSVIRLSRAVVDVPA